MVRARRGSGRIGAALGCALLLAALLPALAAAKAPKRGEPVGPLSSDGRWFTDARGRVVVLHGINMVAKRPPYQPAALGFGPDDAKFLARNGFNTVRLGLIYAGVEPQPGAIDDDYIGRSRQTALKLAKQGIFTMVDFHQDLYNERFDGEGWPGWAVLDDGLPAEPTVGFPGTYLSSPGLNRAFDNFWANAAGPGGVGLQDRYAAAWKRVAREFRRDDAVLGYDVMNEPWPGTDFASCANAAGCPGFDRDELGPMSARAIAAIRSVESRHIVFHEPHVLFNFGVASNLPDLGENLGFSFHDYCLTGLIADGPQTCEEAEALPFDNADAYSKRTGDTPILSEFGATTDVETLERITRYADEHMTSWQEWHYCGCDDPTTSGPGDVQALVRDPAQPPVGANVFSDKLAALARPYPQAVAGTPRSWSFDPADRRFELSFKTRRADGRGRFESGTSLIFLPAIQYPRGYRVDVEGASVVSERGSKRLLLRTRAGAPRVELTVTAR